MKRIANKIRIKTFLPLFEKKQNKKKNPKYKTVNGFLTLYELCYFVKGLL